MVVVGQFSGPHGVQGDFKLRSFTAEPTSIFSFSPLLTKDRRVLTVESGRALKPGLFVTRAQEVKTREACEAYKGELLYIERNALPKPDDADEFYYNDLVGLKALTQDGADAGSVKAVVNYGAGDILELIGVPGRSGVVLVPFTKDAVPEINVAGGEVIVVLPPMDTKSD